MVEKRAVVTEIQVGGGPLARSLEEACTLFKDSVLPKIHFTIQLPDESFRTITIRDDEKGTIAYGSFEGLPAFLDYAKMVVERGK